MAQTIQRRQAASRTIRPTSKRCKTKSSASSHEQFSKSDFSTHYKQRAKIIVGFPGIGKSFVSKHSTDELEPWVLHDEPGYAKGAEDSFFKGVLILAQESDVLLLLPAHRMVGDFLVKNNLEFTSIFPKHSLKNEYLCRYRERGSPPGFVDLVDSKWDAFLENMWYLNTKCNHIELDEGQFLKDILPRVLKTDAKEPEVLQADDAV